MAEAAEALDLMNDQYQIQHLDIKPQNLFLVHNHVKVADFGLAKDLEGIGATMTGGVTPVYAAPETFEGWVSRALRPVQPRHRLPGTAHRHPAVQRHEHPPPDAAAPERSAQRRPAGHARPSRGGAGAVEAAGRTLPQLRRLRQGHQGGRGRAGADAAAGRGPDPHAPPAGRDAPAADLPRRPGHHAGRAAAVDADPRPGRPAGVGDAGRQHPVPLPRPGLHPEAGPAVRPAGRRADGVRRPVPDAARRRRRGRFGRVAAVAE